MMGIKVVQLTSKSHHENILSSLHQLRLQGHFSDIIVQVEFEGDVQEFQAHQVVLAASSGYFKKILLSQDAGQDKLSLSNIHSDNFSKFLEFVYTGKVEIIRDKIIEIQAMAELLDCKGLTEVCCEAMSAGIAQKPKRKKCESNVDQCELEGGKKKKRKRQPASLSLKQQLSPSSSEKKVISKRLKAVSTAKNLQGKEKRLKQKKATDKVLQRNLRTKKQVFNNENQVIDGDPEERNKDEVETQVEKDDESSLEMMVPDVEDWEYEDDIKNDDPDHPLLSLEEDNQEEDGEEEVKPKLKRTSKAQFECNKCQRTFHYEKSYLKHISTYHGVKADVVYRCETCLQTFANRSNLKIHEKHVHSSERLFSCSSCSKTFKRKKDVVRHQRQVHERNNLRHVCPECGKALSSKTALLLHERTHTGAKPFQCTDCNARFSQNAALKMHRRTHTGEKPFACDECDARFTQKHMLAYHKRSHTGEKPFMCEACGKSFASKEYLRHHSNIHTGFKPYKCEKCGRGFAQRNSLHQHLKIHTGERPYSCKDCDKQFTQINALQRHQRIHTGEKPYMCGLCNRTFTDMSTLRRHTMTHDSDAPWKTYLVVLKGNVEDKKTKSPTKGKTEKIEIGEKRNSERKIADADGTAGATGSDGTAADVDGADGEAVANAATGAAEIAGKTNSDSVVVPVEPVTLPSDWSSHGTIALVSHTDLGGITVIHTDASSGTQIQPIMTTDSTGNNIISLDGSAIPVPFSIPVTMAHPVPLSSEAPSSSFSVSSVPVSDGTLSSVSEIASVSTSSVLETAVSQTILAPSSETKITAKMDIIQADIQTVIVGEEGCGEEQTAAGESDEQQRTTDNSSYEPKKASDEEAV